MKSRYLIYSFFCLFITTYCYAQVAGTADASRQLHQLFQEEWDFRMKEFPVFATSCGVHQYNDRLHEVGQQAEERRYQYWKDVLRRLGKIERAVLSVKDQINYDLFKYIIENDTAQVFFKSYLIPINAEGGFYTGFPFLPKEMPFNSKQDFENYLSRLNAFPQYTQQYIQLMRQGITQHRTPAKVILKGYETAIEAQIHPTAEESIFYSPFLEKPTFLNNKEWASLQEQARKIVVEAVMNTYKQFAEFMAKEYYPACREEVGISAIPNGKDYYEQRIAYFTTLPMDSEAVFQTGQQEVARIKREMEAIIKEVAFKGSFKEFLTFLRTDPQFYAPTPIALLKEASYLAKKIDGQLPKLFNKLPRNPYGVEPVPDAIAPKYTGGRYVPGSPDNHQSGTYWVNTFKLSSRPLYVLPALTLHEAVPGHHLQISLAQELDSFPEFRKHTYLSAYGEGWALYGERLGMEMGIYSTPYEEFGRLTYEMWRACRLVVDVGLHVKGWTRKEAIDFLANNTALSVHEVNTEIDRYIGWPGQAVSYKIGELKIRALRKQAEEQLGEKFDIRAFHDVILSNGAVPLFVLDQLVEDLRSESRE